MPSSLPKKILFLTPAGIFLLGALASCQASEHSSRRSVNKGTTVNLTTGETRAIVSNTSVLTQARSSEGTIKGTVAALPPRAMPQPGSLHIETTATPEEFKSLQVNDSSGKAEFLPVKVSTVDAPETSPLQIQQPMVIALSFDSSALALAGEPVDPEGLCAALSDTESKEYFWRHDAVKIDAKQSLLYFESTHVGTFEIVPCAGGIPAGFDDAQLAGLTDGVVDGSLLVPVPDADDTKTEPIVDANVTPAVGE